jgi:hypothetical protein
MRITVIFGKYTGPETTTGWCRTSTQVPPLFGLKIAGVFPFSTREDRWHLAKRVEAIVARRDVQVMNATGAGGLALASIKD